MPNVSSIRLYKSQIDILKKSKGYGSKVITFALKRLRNGEITQKAITLDEPLLPYSVRIDLPYSDKDIREILQAHFDNPKDRSKEIEMCDKEVDYLMSLYTGRPYLLVEELI